MEIKVIKNNLLVELVIHSQIKHESIFGILEKYKDCQIIEFKIKLNPNTLMGNVQYNDFESIAIILE
jgi:hypothetical protein